MALQGGPGSPKSRRGRWLGSLKPPRASRRAPGARVATKHDLRSSGPAEKAALAKQCLRDLAKGAVSVSVPGYGLDDSFGVKLAEALRSSGGQPSPVKMLELERNMLGEPTAAGLGRALASARSRIQVIELGSNALGDSGARALADGLRASGSLQQLDLQSNGIGPLGAEHLSAALVGNRHVKALHLGGNRIGPNGVRMLVEGLELNFALQTLSLFDCGVGDLGAQYIARSLSRASSLRELSIGQNVIRDHGAAALGEMLRANRELKELHLEKNDIGDGGASRIAESLLANHALQQLWLPENPITEVAILKFAECLEKNMGIQNLGLSFSGCPDAACVEALRRAKQKRLERRRAATRPGGSMQGEAKMSTRSAAQSDAAESARSPRGAASTPGLSARSAFGVAIGSARDSPAGADAFLELDHMPASVSEAVIGEIQDLEADLNDRASLLVWELPQPSARTPRSSRSFAPAVMEEDSDSSDDRANRACAGVFSDSDLEDGN